MTERQPTHDRETNNKNNHDSLTGQKRDDNDKLNAQTKENNAPWWNPLPLAGD